MSPSVAPRLDCPEAGSNGADRGGVYRSGSGRDDKQDVHSRAYLAFINEHDLLAFHRAYNGWAFRDKQGQSTERARRTSLPTASLAPQLS